MRKPTWAMFLMGVLSMSTVLALSSPSQTQTSEWTIVKIKVPELDLFDGKGNNIGKLNTSSLTLPLPVFERGPGGRLKIRLADGRFVWINGAFVTSQASKDVAPCDPGRGMTAGATRGSGAHCK